MHEKTIFLATRTPRLYKLIYVATLVSVTGPIPSCREFTYSEKAILFSDYVNWESKREGISVPSLFFCQFLSGRIRLNTSAQAR